MPHATNNRRLSPLTHDVVTFSAFYHQLPPIVGHRTWSALHGVAAVRRHVPEKPVQNDWTFEQMLNLGRGAQPIRRHRCGYSFFARASARRDPDA